MHFISLFCPCFYGEAKESQIWFTIRFSLRPEKAGSIVHHVLKSSAQSGHHRGGARWDNIITSEKKNHPSSALRNIEDDMGHLVVLSARPHIWGDLMEQGIFEEVMDYRTYCWAIAKTYCWAIAISR